MAQEYARYVTQHTRARAGIPRRTVRLMDAVVGMLYTGVPESAASALFALSGMSVSSLEGSWAPLGYLMDCCLHHMLAMDPLRLLDAPHDTTVWTVYHALQSVALLAEVSDGARRALVRNTVVMTYLAAYADTSCPALEWSLHALRALRAVADTIGPLASRETLNAVVAAVASVLQSKERHVGAPDAMEVMGAVIASDVRFPPNIPLDDIIHRLVRVCMETTDDAAALVPPAIACLAHFARRAQSDVLFVVCPMARNSVSHAAYCVLSHTMARGELSNDHGGTVSLCWAILLLDERFLRAHAPLVVDILWRCQNSVPQYVVSMVLSKSVRN